ncbi:tyrosinase cofactor [Streptomyces sp. NBC_00344]|uniref:tyrosinase cofactor n=1 Tax=Streptomyces sp. NBC_00344 TaxID=2975720 RepID=UPI002E21003D
MEASSPNKAGVRWLSYVPRRAVLRGVFALSVVGGTAGALTPVMAADEDAAQTPALGLRHPFDEMYRGRHIHGGATVDGTEILVDGRPLHVMRRADGSYLSMVNHYESYPTPLDVARAAVDELGSAELSLTSMQTL